MPDKKLTDSEIVKALECSVKDKCPECPYFHSYPCDKCREMRKDVLDLINRLQEEKEALINGQETLQKYIADLQAENERLKNAYKQCAWERDVFAEDMKEEIKKDCSYLMLDIKTIKAEAYKEFAERLKEETLTTDKFGEIMLVQDVDNLLKELVGEDK